MTIALDREGIESARPESVELLDGGAQTYPRMPLAIDKAQRSVHLEVYSFAPGGVGARFHH